MGGLDPTGDYVLELLRAGQAGRHREQAARRAARRRALRGGVGGRRPAPLRGERLRGDPGDQGAARGARRHERPPRARDRQRDDELHPHRRWRPARPTTRRSRTRRGRATPRPIRPTTSPAPTPPRRWRSSRPSRSGRASTLDDVDYRGIDEITAEHVAAARELDMVVRLVGHGDARRRARRRPRPPGARRPPSSARRGRGRVQRRHAPGRRDPRDHARGPGRRRDRDGLGRDRRHGQRDRDDGHRLPAERRRAGGRCRALPPGELRSPFYFHLSVDDRPGVLAHVAERLAAARGLDRAPRPAAERHGAACTSSRTRRAGARSPTRSRRSARCRRLAGRRPPSRRLRPRRRGARMGVMPLRRALPRPAAGRRQHAARHARRGRRRRSCRAPRLSERLGVEL